MVETEQLRSPTSKGEGVKEQEALPVVRIFPWALRSSQKILSDLSLGDTPRLLEVYLAEKSEDSPVAPGQLIPLGGRINPGESLISAAYRKLDESSTLYVAPYGDTQERSGFRKALPGRYYYDISDSRYPDRRRVSFVMLPALSIDIVQAHFPHTNTDKIVSSVGLTIDELEESIVSGEHEGKKLVEHMTKTFTPIETDYPTGEVRKKNEQLEKLIDEMTVLEESLEESLLQCIKNRFAKELPSHLLGPTISIGLLQLYESVKGELGAQSADRVIQYALEDLETSIYANHFREKEERTFHLRHPSRATESGKSANFVKEGLTRGNYGLDILHLLPQRVMQVNQEIHGTFLMEAYQNMLIDIFSASAYAAGYGFENAMDLFMDASPEQAQERIAAKKKCHKAALAQIGALYGYPDAFVHDAWSQSAGFFREFGDSVKIHALPDTDQQRDFQIYEVRNEINNALFPELVTLARRHQDSEVRFEAERQLFIFFKTLFAKEAYDKIVKGANLPFREAVADFFGHVQDQEQIEYRNKVFATRITPDSFFIPQGIRLIVDNKPKKKLFSFVRKSMEEPMEEIQDVFSCSIAFIEDTKRDKALTPEDHIRITKQLARGFLSYLTTIYPDHKVEVAKRKDTFELFQQFLKGKRDSSKFTPSGKRTGSQADLIVRSKLNITITDPDGEEYRCEFSFYPFFSLAAEDQQVLFWGLEQKFDDDDDYARRRIELPIQGAKGLRSFGDCITPPHLYKHSLEQRKRSKKKSTGRD